MKQALKEIFFKKITITYVARISGKRVKKTFTKYVFFLMPSSYAVSKALSELQKDRKVIVKLITIK